jgi:2-furoyl-CoA dehydrogenase FAD binding subunit
MKPPPFAYLRAETSEEALTALAEHGGEARVLAGGQSLMAMLNMRLARPTMLVDIMRVPSLGTLAAEAGALVVGAGVRQAGLQARPGLAREVPLLAAALPWVGHWQTRARGTVCGSIAHADPSAELPLVLAVLGGEVRLRSRRRRRRVPAETFFAGMMLTARDDDELIEQVAFPLAREGETYAFAEVGRRHGDFAIVGCAAAVSFKHMRLAVCGVDDRPVVRTFPALERSALDDALNEFAWELPAREDVHATGRYRRDLVRQLGRKVLMEASSCHC